MDKALQKDLDRYIARLQDRARRTRPVSIREPFKGIEYRAAVASSARRFLAYCALVNLFRRNLSALNESSCVLLVTVASTWSLKEVQEAAGLIFSDDRSPKIAIHPVAKSKRGWEIDVSEQLEHRTLVVLVSEGSLIHEDFELVATARVRLPLCDPRHLRAVARLRRCGEISDDGVALIAQQPSDRMEAVFRIGQPAQRTVQKLSDTNYQRPATDEVRHPDISTGFGEAGAWAAELRKDIRDWREGRLSWSEVDKGGLLHGPTGTGKTRFAAALAKACELHFEATSVATWQRFKDGDLGDMLKSMYLSFAAAKENAPSLLFIDEIDAIGDRSKFPSRHDTYSTTVVNGLLEALDGIDGREGVVVLGACNHPEKIDPALLRSGRLERHLHFPKPDAEARAQILAFHLPTLAHDDALRDIAARLPEKTGADLERLARDARRIARRERRPVNLDDVRNNIEPFAALNIRHLLQIAVHEAGHALVAHALNVGKVERVEIFDNVNTFATALDAHGLTTIERPRRPFHTRWEMMKEITANLAGAAAEEVFFKDISTMSSGKEGSDFAKATTLAIEMVAKFGFGTTRYFLPGSVDIHRSSELWQDERLEAEVTDILQAQYDRAFDMLSAFEKDLAVFATKLAKDKILQGNELEKLWPGQTDTGPKAVKS